MICDTCGTVLKDDAKFCSQCGAPVTPIAPTPEPEPPKVTAPPVVRNAESRKSAPKSDPSVDNRLSALEKQQGEILAAIRELRPVVTETKTVVVEPEVKVTRTKTEVFFDNLWQWFKTH